MDTHGSINVPFSLTVWPEGKTPMPSDADGAFPNLTYYLPSDEYRTGQSVLILPGGGYGLVSSPKEGHRPAQYLAAHGIAAGVLEYRHSPQRHPVPLIDAQRGMRLLRQQAAIHGLDPHQVGCMGFSAGGHLCGTVATQMYEQAGLIGDDLDGLSCAPDFAIGVYPVVSLTAPDVAHIGSGKNLLGEPVDQELAEKLSVEKAVRADFPPFFLVHGQNDMTVPVENSIQLYLALTKHGVSATMHLYEDMPHGIGLAANHPWGPAMIAWLAEQQK
jgi:acetyl esterase/lipase